MGRVNNAVGRFAARMLQPALNAQRGHAVTEIRALIAAEWERCPAMLNAQWERYPDAYWNRTRVDKGTQTLLQLTYRDMLRQGKPLPALDEVGFRAFSQFDEDGILLYLFSLLGVAHKTSVEICAGTGYECNTANLIINHAWDGLLIDGNPENVRIAREFYARYPDTFWRRPTIAHAWVDAETVNDLISENGFKGEIDLFSLDMDGVDFWIWKAITCVNPRVVVLEFNDCIPADVSVALPYDRSFVVSEEKSGYLNASLAAWVKLGREKGYRLVGINRNAVNAFFVRNDLGQDLAPEVSAARCLDDRFTRAKSEARWATMSTWDWVTI
jgi:hypothetical protein